jgi:hypothetical protein
MNQARISVFLRDGINHQVFYCFLHHLFGAKINKDSRKDGGRKFGKGAFMKKTAVGISVAIVAAALVVVVAAGCASVPPAASSSGSVAAATSTAAPASATAKAERSAPGGVPEFVRDAVKTAPENALVGIGVAKMGTISLSRTTSATRGRAEISRQLDTLIKDMVRDYQASSEVDPSSALAFQENITVALFQARLQGSSVVDENTDTAGNYWTVVMLSKSEVAKEINQAAASAKLAVPKAASFDAEARMNAAFDAVKQDVQVVSN